LVERKKMTEKEKLMAQNSKATSIISDLLDQIEDGCPWEIQKKHREKIRLLEDIIFYNGERMEILDGNVLD
jgi:uncharacterized protein YabN with tetrapyrrole methylase and pyrophosphatase domain